MRRNRTFRRGTSAARPTRTWADVSPSAVFAAVTTTSTAVLIQLQAPTTLSALTADPPEDLTVLRLVGDLTVAIASGAAANWTLALVVQDVTWTPGNTVSVDNDKRILWARTFKSVVDTTGAKTWEPPGVYWNGTTAFPAANDPGHVDIAPKVKIEPGRALYLVAYENVASAALTVTSENLRVLFQRTKRRS